MDAIELGKRIEVYRANGFSDQEIGLAVYNFLLRPLYNIRINYYDILNALRHGAEENEEIRAFFRTALLDHLGFVPGE